MVIGVFIKITDIAGVFLLLCPGTKGSFGTCGVRTSLFETGKEMRVFQEKIF